MRISYIAFWSSPLYPFRNSASFPAHIIFVLICFKTSILLLVLAIYTPKYVTNVRPTKSKTFKQTNIFFQLLITSSDSTGVRFHADCQSILRFCLSFYIFFHTILYNLESSKICMPHLGVSPSSVYFMPIIDLCDNLQLLQKETPPMKLEKCINLRVQGKVVKIPFNTIYFNRVIAVSSSIELMTNLHSLVVLITAPLMVP